MRSYANEEGRRWPWSGAAKGRSKPNRRRVSSAFFLTPLPRAYFLLVSFTDFYWVFTEFFRLAVEFLPVFYDSTASLWLVFPPFFLKRQPVPCWVYRVLPSFTEFYRVSEARFDSRPQRNRPKHWTGRERDPFSVLACIFCSFFLYLFIFTEFFFPFPADGSDGADAADVDGWRPGRVDNKDR